MQNLKIFLNILSKIWYNINNDTQGGRYENK